MPSITHSNLPYLKYGIREVVETAQKIKKLDPSRQFVWENIGDPIAKGWSVPEFLKSLIIEEMRKTTNDVFGYAHSRGNIETRSWIVEYAKRFSPKSTLTPDDILLTN